jgi:hypothetical protein
MGIIPHPLLYFKEIRPLDIWVLLLAGFGYEVCMRLYLLLVVKMKSTQLTLQSSVNHYRQLGPPAFVQCSKLERQYNAMEKELQAIYERRKATAKLQEKYLKTYAHIFLGILIFFIYYGVPLIVVEPLENEWTPEKIADYQQQQAFAAKATPLDGETMVPPIVGATPVPVGTLFKALLFPVSYIGVSARITKLSGIATEDNPYLYSTSVSALLIFWSAQVTATKLMDALDAYVL